MEYIRGSDLERLGPTAGALLNGEHGHKLLKELGLLVSLDILTNNWDRLPVLWDNEG